jgi:hypothetical protein
MEEMNGMMSYHAFRIGTKDVIMVILLITACYVFGKIWRGCTYLILLLAAMFYYMLH